MEPWKRTYAYLYDATASTLQWGHGDGAVEEAMYGEDRHTRELLQWGHGDGAVEEAEIDAFLA